MVVGSAESALKSAFLVNGGGAVALLAFFGQASRQGLPASSWLSLALLALVVGTALASTATGLSFLAQYGYMMGKRRARIGRYALIITAMNVVLVMLSHVCFLVAGLLAYKGLR